MHYPGAVLLPMSADTQGRALNVQNALADDVGMGPPDQTSGGLRYRSEDLLLNGNTWLAGLDSVFSSGVGSMGNPPRPPTSTRLGDCNWRPSRMVHAYPHRPEALSPCRVHV